jgi:predicted nucleotidyltransferase component of viral defense system
MATYNKQTLAAQAQELGFVRDTLEKVVRLTDILKFMESDPLLGTSLALKGGTAINLTVFNLPRLSVDIDLDYAHNNSLDDMIKDREEITAVIKRYMAAEGYELSSKSKNYHSLDSFVYAFENSAGAKDNVKIEINYSVRCHVLPLVTRPIETMGVFSAINVLSVAPIEIYASKIVALLTRAAARDLFDINQMVLAGLFDESESIMLRKCAIFYFAVGTEETPKDFDFERIFSLTSHKIRTDLQPVLRKRDWFDLPAAQERVRTYLGSLLVLEEDERDFLDAFRNGEYTPELLFDAETLVRVKNPPMATWKLAKKR